MYILICYMGGSIHGDIPVAGWFIMEHPQKNMDDKWCTPFLGNLHMVTCLKTLTDFVHFQKFRIPSVNNPLKLPLKSH